MAQAQLSEPARVSQRRAAHRLEDRIRVGEAGDRIHTHRRVVVVILVKLRMHVIPVVLQQPVNIVEHRGEAGKPVDMQIRVGEVDRGAQVLALAKNSERLFLDVAPVRLRALDDGVADLLLFRGLGRDLEFREREVVFQILAARRVIALPFQQRFDVYRHLRSLLREKSPPRPYEANPARGRFLRGRCSAP